MTRRLPRALQGIERNLAGSDPGLDALFRSERVRDWCAENWTDP